MPESTGDIGHVVGVDLGGTKMVGAVVDLDGRIKVRLRQPTRLGKEPPIARLISLIRSLIKSSGHPMEDIKAISLGVPGVTDVNSGVVEWAATLDWKNFALRDTLVREFGIPVIVENDVNMIALGEYWYGVGRGKDPLFCMAIGSGVGGGLILNGQLYRGPHGSAGEVGYMVVDRSFLGQDYRAFGCLESLISGFGLVRRANEAGWRVGGQAAPTITAAAITEAAKEGDSLCRSLLDDLIDFLSMAIVNITATIDPQMIALAGGLSQAVAVFLDRIRRNVASLVPSAPEIAVSFLKEDAGIMGAIAAALCHARPESLVPCPLPCSSGKSEDKWRRR